MTFITLSVDIIFLTLMINLVIWYFVVRQAKKNFTNQEENKGSIE